MFNTGFRFGEKICFQSKTIQFTYYRDFQSSTQYRLRHIIIKL